MRRALLFAALALAPACNTLDGGTEYGTHTGDVRFEIELPAPIEANAGPERYGFKAWLLEPAGWNAIGGREAFVGLQATLAEAAPGGQEELAGLTAKLDRKALVAFRQTSITKEIPLAPLFLVMRNDNTIRYEDFNALKLVPPKLSVIF